MKKYAIGLSLLAIVGCSLHVSASGGEASSSDEPHETIVINNTSLQPLGCSGPIVLYTSGGRYILPIDRIDKINTYVANNGNTHVAIDTSSTNLVFQLIGEDGLNRFNKLLDRVCF